MSSTRRELIDELDALADGARGRSAECHALGESIAKWTDEGRKLQRQVDHLGNAIVVALDSLQKTLAALVAGCDGEDPADDWKRGETGPI